MEVLSQKSLWIMLIAMIWVLPWKGYALWTAAREKHKRWFIVLIILNTFAILDIFYIFYIAKRNPKDIVRIFRRKI